MANTTTTYRKTKAGQWVVFGPESLVIEGEVAVTKRDGTTKTEIIESVGRTFECDGIQARYGYIARKNGQKSKRFSEGEPLPPASECCIRCGGNGSVEQELGTCQGCGTDFDG